MPGRTWIIAPDAESLERRWQRLIHVRPEEKKMLFHPHLDKEKKPGDRHVMRLLPNALPGCERRPKRVADETDPCVTPIHYGFRSFDRQWFIPDNRLINRPNPELWKVRSEQQVYMTAPSDRSPTAGPALTISALIPDLHHYSGRGDRVFPLWRGHNASIPNLPAKLLIYLSQQYGHEVGAEDLVAYIAATVAHPAFTARFQNDLSTPGLHIPLTNDWAIFAGAVDLGRTVVWLHTFGERMSDPQAGRPAQPPRLPLDRRPHIPAAGAIPTDPEAMPDTIGYDAGKKRLLIGQGYVENVEHAVWMYEVSGKQVLSQWFSYRRAHRDRPLIGDRRPPSPLGDIQPDHWIAEYTTELINVLNVLGWLVDLEPAQADLLHRVCAGPTISAEELRVAGALATPVSLQRRTQETVGSPLFDLSTL